MVGPVRGRLAGRCLAGGHLAIGCLAGDFLMYYCIQFSVHYAATAAHREIFGVNALRGKLDRCVGVVYLCYLFVLLFGPNEKNLC